MEQLTNRAMNVDMAVMADNTIRTISFHGIGFLSEGLLSM